MPLQILRDGDCLAAAELSAGQQTISYSSQDISDS